MLAALQRDADRAGQLDWNTYYVDGTVVRAHQHAVAPRSSSATKAKATRLCAARSPAGASAPSFRAAPTNVLTTGGTVRSTAPHTASGIGWSGSSTP